MSAERAFTIRPLDVGETYELRRRVLRNNDPGARVHIREDDRDDAWHLGAVNPAGAVIATASFYPIPCSFRPEITAATQLRFMAVDGPFQSTGVGAALIRAAVTRLRAEGRALLWANARNTARAFYVRMGFVAVGESFIEPTTGLAHTVVTKSL